MSSDYVEEELEIIEERISASKVSRDIAAGIDIEDPIRIINLSPVISVKSGTSLRKVVDLLNEKRIGCVTITNEKGDTVGIFTERDILRKVTGRGLDFHKEVVDNYMTLNPEVLSEDDPIAFALNRMADGGFRHIPITRNKEVKFMLSIKDIVDEIARVYRKRVLNLPPDLRQETSQYGG